jgi:hypothetical protein
VAVMVFKLKSMAFPIKLTSNDPNQGKKLYIFEILGFGLWVWPSKFFFGFIIFFFISLVSKKSSGVQKSYV